MEKLLVSHQSIKSVITFTLIIDQTFEYIRSYEKVNTIMRQHNIAEALVLVLTLIVKSCLCERRVSQEEWHRYHFGGMAVPSDPNQWTMTVPNSYSNNSPDVEAQVGAANSQFETNIQTVEVGKDKLVLVNDEGSIKMVKASQLPTVNKQASAPATTEVPNTVIQMPLDQYYAKG